MKHNIWNVLAVLAALAMIYFALTHKVTPSEVPTDTTAQGKVDINTVCEGALAYMTFTDAASAEAFVAECKEGKHPEVLERYQADLDLGDGAQI